MRVDSRGWERIEEVEEREGEVADEDPSLAWLSVGDRARLRHPSRRRLDIRRAITGSL